MFRFFFEKHFDFPHGEVVDFPLEEFFDSKK